MRSALASVLVFVAGCGWFSTNDEEFAIPEQPAGSRSSGPVRSPGPTRSGTFDPERPEPARSYRTSTLAYADVRAGDAYTCARMEQDTIDCWGKPPNDPSMRGAELAVRGDTICALDDAGKVTCWGDTVGYLAPDAAPFHALGVGYRFACALDATDHPQCWGPAAIAAPDDVELAALSVGWSHACGLMKSDGTIVCWGNASTSGATPPTGAFTSIAAGGLMTCALDAGEHVKCWGDFKGSGPVSRFTQVSVGNGIACGVSANDGFVTCWGNDLIGIKQVPPRRYSQISVGTDHACAIGAIDEKIECWGGNGSGQAYPP